MLQVSFIDFGGGRTFRRGVPVRYIETIDGRVAVTTGLDLLMAQYGVPRGLAGDYPASYDDEEIAYTPAWQEKFTGRRPKDRGATGTRIRHYRREDAMANAPSLSAPASITGTTTICTTAPEFRR